MRILPYVNVSGSPQASANRHTQYLREFLINPTLTRRSISLKLKEGTYHSHPFAFSLAVFPRALVVSTC